MIARLAFATETVDERSATATADVPDTVEDSSLRTRLPERKLTWAWRWEHGLRYQVARPLPEFVPETGPLGHELDRRIAMDGAIGFRLQVDAAGYAATGTVNDDYPGIQVRRLYVGTSGTFSLLGHVDYAVDLELTGGDVQVGDSYLAFHDLPYVQTLQIGNFDPAFSLEAVTSSRDILFMERATAVEALTPGRKAGLQIGGPVLEQRATWALGAFGNVGRGNHDVGDQSTGVGRIDGRVTWLLTDAAPAELTHLGIGIEYAFAADTIRYRTRPESHLASHLLDTEDLDAHGAAQWSLEFATIRGPLTIEAEHMGAAVETAGTVAFHGGYLAASRFLTDDVQPYDHTRGRLGRVLPSRPFSFHDRTWGAFRVGARLSYLDLEHGPVRGGREINVTLDAAWHLTDWLAYKVEYGVASIHGRPQEGALHFVQTRLQIDFY